MPACVASCPSLPGIEGFPRTWDFHCLIQKGPGQTGMSWSTYLGSKIRDVGLRGQVTELRWEGAG